MIFGMKNKDIKSAKLKRRLSRRDNIEAWILLLPLVLILYIYVWRPTVMGGVWSFFDMKGYTVKDFCGFDNYLKVIKHTQFLPMLGNTIEYVFWSLVLGFLPPIALAIMLNEIIHFKNGFRVLVYIPAVIPGIAAMLIWYYIYYPDQTGLLNMLLGRIGIDPYVWLNDPKFVILGLSLYSVWKGAGGATILYYAALQGISSEVYEAAIIDGAGPWKRLWHVTRPGIEGLMLLNLVRQIIANFQILELPLAMTSGGPNGASASLAYQLYQYGFNSGGKGTGQAMALGVIIFLILICFTIFYFWLNKKVESRY